MTDKEIYELRESDNGQWFKIYETDGRQSFVLVAEIKCGKELATFFVDCLNRNMENIK